MGLFGDIWPLKPGLKTDLSETPEGRWRRGTILGTPGISSLDSGEQTVIPKDNTLHLKQGRRVLSPKS